MKKGYAYFILLCSLIAFIFTSIPAHSDGGKDKNPKTQGWQDPVEHIISWIPVWTLNDNAKDCDSCGMRITAFMYTNIENIPFEINNYSQNWRFDTTAKYGTPLEIIIPDSVLKNFLESDEDGSWDSAGLYKNVGLKMYSYPPLSCIISPAYPTYADGYSVAPVHSLGKEYVLASYRSSKEIDDPASISFTSIVSAYNHTKVIFTYGGSGQGYILTKSGKKLTAGISDTVILGVNDVWFIPVHGPKSDITGSRVVADKPVACFSGHTNTNVAGGAQKSGFIIEQDVPKHQWEKKYYVTPIKGAHTNSILRLFAAESATAIFRNGWLDQVATIPKDFGPENEGWAEIRSAEGEPQAVTLLSEKRFNVIQYNSGPEESGINSLPFQMAVTPYVEMFRGHFAVNSQKNKKNASEKDYLNIVYPATSNDSIPRNLVVGELNSNNVMVWTPLGVRFGEELGFVFTDPTNPVQDRKYYCKQIELPEGKSFQIKGNDKYAVYSYGFTEKGGYGYPLSHLYYEFEGTPDTVSPSVYYTMDCLGNVPDPATGQPAYTKDLPEDPEERSNIAVIYFDKNYSYNYVLENDEFVPGEDSVVKFKLTVIDPRVDARAVITVTDRAGNDTTVIFEYIAPKISIEPASQYYGAAKTGEMKTYAFKLKNNSQDKEYHLKNLRLKKGDEGFTLTPSFPFGITFQPGESRDFTITYKAKDQLFHDDSVGVEDDCALLYKGYVYAGPIVSTNEPTSEIAFDASVLPNPLDSRGGQLEFDNPSDGNVEIALFNSLNQQVAVLQSGWMKAGKQSIRIPIESLPSGAYTYRITAGKNATSGKFVIAK